MILGALRSPGMIIQVWGYALHSSSSSSFMAILNLYNPLLGTPMVKPKDLAISQGGGVVR